MHRLPCIFLFFLLGYIIHGLSTFMIVSKFHLSILLVQCFSNVSNLSSSPCLVGDHTKQYIFFSNIDYHHQLSISHKGNSLSQQSLLDLLVQAQCFQCEIQIPVFIYDYSYVFNTLIINFSKVFAPCKLFCYITNHYKTFVFIFLHWIPSSSLLPTYILHLNIFVFSTCVLISSYYTGVICKTPHYTYYRLFAYF